MELWRKIKLAFKPNKPKKIRIVDPERLYKRVDFPTSKNYEKYKKLYNWDEVSKLDKYVNGKRVKYWRLVNNSGAGPEGDEFIPIFYKKHERRRRKGG